MRSKDRAAGILANSNSNQKLLRALVKSSKKSRKSLVPILNKLSQPGNATKVNNMISNSKKQTPIMLSAETALALISSCGLSQDDYQTIRNVAKSHQADIFPSYHQVLKAKKECLPTNIEVTDTCAEQALQNLLDHTSQRLVSIDSIRETIFGTIEPDKNNNELVLELNLRCKWGFDGATGQSQYKQRFSDNSSDDKCLFSIMLVPLDLSDEKV